MSVFSSWPISLAVSLLPSVKLAVISSAPSMTWLLVTMMPARIDDEAGAERLDAARPAVRASPPCWLKNSSKKSWNGEPSGSCGARRRCRASR